MLFADGHVDWRRQIDLILVDLNNPGQIWGPLAMPSLAKKWNTVAPQWHTDNLP